VLHDDVRLAGLEATDVEDADDVLAADPRCRPSLAEESLGVGGVLSVKELDRDPLAELEVPAREDDSHTAPAEHARHRVSARHDLSDRDGQVSMGRGHGA
jgi:hypothetical protein